MYHTGSWGYPRHMVFKIEKSYDQLTHLYTFIVANIDMGSYQSIRLYYDRGKMENFIKESKNGFDSAAVNSHSKVVNFNRMRIYMFA